jgi:Ca-activated chloride channel family protein
MTKQERYPIKKISFIILGFEVLFWLLLLVALNLLNTIGSHSTATQFEFAQPSYLLLTAVLVPFYWLFLRKLNRKNNFFATMPHSIQSLISPQKNHRAVLRDLFLFRTAIVCIILAMGQPVFGTKKMASSTFKSEIIFCIDISNSMNAKDISPAVTRLEIAKRGLIEFMNQLKGERVGIVVFAGNSFVQLPITTDYGSAKTFLQEVETTMISNQGTNINDALNLAKSLFSPINCPKRILLITDGENHAEDPTASISSLRNQHIGLFVLGIGTENGGPIMRNPDRPELGYVTENDRTIISKVNVALLKSLALKANGSATLCSSEFPDFSQLLTEINQNKGEKTRDLQLEVQSEQYHWFVVLAVVCLMLLQLLTFKQLRYKK